LPRRIRRRTRPTTPRPRRRLVKNIIYVSNIRCHYASALNVGGFEPTLRTIKRDFYSIGANPALLAMARPLKRRIKRQAGRLYSAHLPGRSPPLPMMSIAGANPDRLGCGESQPGGAYIKRLSMRIGSLRTRSPVAWNTALATAAFMPTMPISPMPFIPRSLI
jgi:hypothetical protein